jgi:hypothetical protein
VTGNSLILSTESEVDELEKKYGITFPNGFREFMSKFGEGTLGCYLRFYSPKRIEHGPYGQTEWLE